MNTVIATLVRIVAAVVSVGWLVALALAEADASISVSELIVNDVGSLPFTTGPILAPAVVGAAIGQALRPSQPPLVALLTAQKSASCSSSNNVCLRSMPPA